MADTGLYDASGRPLVLDDAAGYAPTWDVPAQQAVQVADRDGRAAPPAPGPAAPAAQQVARPTTQQVQAHSEYAEGAEMLGGAAYIPFGPAIEVGDADPGFPFAWTDQGPRRTFRLSDRIGLMPLLRFAHAAKAGVNTDDMEGMAALYDLIRDTIDPADWPAFESYATECKAEDEDLMEFVSKALEVISARPRQRRGNSSATSPNTPARSRASSSARATPIPPGAIVPPEADGLMPVADLTR